MVLVLVYGKKDNMADNLVPRSAGDPGKSLLANAAAGQAPAKADAAPKPSATNTGTGLIAALNAYWGGLANIRGFIPDIYEIKFAEPMLMNASVVPPGPLDKSFAGGSLQVTAADELLSEKQRMSPTVRQRSATAGQQIVQFIDTVLRNSTYITDQQKVYWNNATNSWDKDTKKSAQNFVWFNISCQAEQLQYDPAQNDFAYRLTYIIAPYQVPVISEYFDNDTFRGVHKTYNYWFTGQNTQIISFEQQYDKAWTQVVSSDTRTGAGQETLRSQVNSREQWKKRYMPASGQARQGGAGSTFEPGANAADYLYSASTARIVLQTLGDPAWIPPPTNIQPGQFVTSPFFPDGAINTTSSAPFFEFAWNKPTDYDPNTGLMDPGQNNFGADRGNGIAGIAQVAQSYQCTSVKNTFRAGRFTQELTGKWLQIPAKTADSGRNTDPPSVKAKTEPGRTAEIINRVAPTQPGRTADTIKKYQAGVVGAISANLSADQVAVLGLPSSTLPANSIASINNAEPRPAVPPTVDVGLQLFDPFVPPPVLGAGYVVGDEDNTAFVSPNPPQGIVNDDQGKPQ
jgi:hypothetical protein